VSQAFFAAILHHSSLTQVGSELGRWPDSALAVADHTDLVVEEKAAIVKIGCADHGHIVIDHQGLECSMLAAYS
jgi:hypothetical protein